MTFQEWIPSKERTDTTVHTLADILRDTGVPDILLGFCILWFHVIAGLLLVLCLLFFPCQTPFFFLCVFLWNVVIFSNYYFHGCLLSRLEREFFHMDTWYGPVSLMNALKFITKDVANLVIKFFFAIPVSIIVLLRFVWHRDTLGLIWPVLLAIFYMPFMFKTSQQVLFTKLVEALDSLASSENWEDTF